MCIVLVLFAFAPFARTSFLLLLAPCLSKPLIVWFSLVMDHVTHTLDVYASILSTIKLKIHTLAHKNMHETLFFPSRWAKERPIVEESDNNNNNKKEENQNNRRQRTCIKWKTTMTVTLSLQFCRFIVRVPMCLCCVADSEVLLRFWFSFLFFFEKFSRNRMHYICIHLFNFNNKSKNVLQQISFEWNRKMCSQSTYCVPNPTYQSDIYFMR